MLLALAAYLAGAAQYTVYSRERNWAVMSSNEGCALLVSYDNNAQIWLTYRSRMTNSDIIITDPSFRSVDDGKSYKLDLIFVGGRSIDRSWGTVNFDGNVLGPKRGVAALVNSNDILSSVARSNILALEKDGEILLSLSLAGSTKSIMSLRRCAAEIDRINPADPLDGLEERSK